MKYLVAVLAVLAIVGSVFAGSAGKSDKDKQEAKADVSSAEEAKVESIYGSRPYIVDTIQVSGEIDDSTVADIKKQVQQINDNPRVKAVVLELNSPGGGSAASAASYEELSKIKVPVVAWCDQLCASGAYYIAMSPAVKFIGLRQEALTGSVGVIMHLTRYSRLLEFLKIDSETHASGSLKDSGDPSKAPSADEEKYLQSIVDALAKRFYAVVAKARPNVKSWDQVKTGRVFIGEEAVGLGLVDGVMDLDGAIKKAKSISGVKMIFTRDEMKRMSQLADQPSSLKAPALKPLSQGWESDLHQLVSLIMEAKSGEAAVFQYRMPIRF